MYKTFKDFAAFYNHPFIKSIQNDKKWTVSDKLKRPIDMVKFKEFNRICGAEAPDESSLITLGELCATLPDATNNAYYMDALTDNFVILDIEKTCPDEVKQEFLKTPYIYGEISMSGKGLHLVYPLPPDFSKYPIAQKKVVMKEKHGWYEILLQHYITFTRNMIPEATGNSTAFLDAFKELAANQKETNRTDVNIEDIELKDIPEKDRILELLSSVRYNKTIEDFFGDVSRYEYGCVGRYYIKLKQLLSLKKYRDNHTYTDTEIAYLLYDAVRDKIPYRPKHDEIRDGLPWLLYLIKEIMAKDEQRSKSKGKK